MQSFVADGVFFLQDGGSSGDAAVAVKPRRRRSPMRKMGSWSGLAAKPLTPPGASQARKGLSPAAAVFW